MSSHGAVQALVGPCALPGDCPPGRWTPAPNDCTPSTCPIHHPLTPSAPDPILWAMPSGQDLSSERKCRPEAWETRLPSPVTRCPSAHPRARVEEGISVQRRCSDSIRAHTGLRGDKDTRNFLPLWNFALEWSRWGQKILRTEKKKFLVTAIQQQTVGTGPCRDHAELETFYF